MIDNQVSGKSTTEPPRAVTRESLQAWEPGEQYVPSALLPLIRWHAQGEIPNARPTQKPTGSPSPGQRDEWKRLTQRSGDVILLLAAMPFLRTRVDALPWSPTGGIPECTVALDGLHTKTWPEISAVPYTVSVAAVNKDPSILRRAVAQGRFPFLHFALALGMHEESGRYPLTALVIDIATGWVSTVVHQLKHLQQVPRAYEPPFNRFAAPLVPKPGFTAFPGGHAALGHALAELLGELTEAESASRTRLHDLAVDLGQTREKAGLHCALDTERGRDLGTTLAGWMTDPATLADPRFAAWSALFAHAREEWK